MDRAAHLSMAGAAGASVFLVMALKPTSTAAFAFLALWLSAPHLLLSVALIILRRKGCQSLCWTLAALTTSAGGMLMLADAIFWHPDAQGAIAVFMTPPLQAVTLAALLPLARRASKRR